MKNATPKRTTTTPTLTGTLPVVNHILATASPRPTREGAGSSSGFNGGVPGAQAESAVGPRVDSEGGRLLATDVGCSAGRALVTDTERSGAFASGRTFRPPGRDSPFFLRRLEASNAPVQIDKPPGKRPDQAAIKQGLPETPAEYTDDGTDQEPQQYGDQDIDRHVVPPHRSDRILACDPGPIAHYPRDPSPQDRTVPPRGTMAYGHACEHRLNMGHPPRLNIVCL